MSGRYRNHLEILLLSFLTFALGLTRCEGQAKPAASIKTFRNEGLGISFHYPTTLLVERNPATAPMPVESSLIAALSAARPTQSPASDETPHVELYFVRTQFSDTLAMRSLAPTGLEDSAPEARIIAGRTFYFYGAGGGGVSYPDKFFTPLRSGFLAIFFPAISRGKALATE